MLNPTGANRKYDRPVRVCIRLTEAAVRGQCGYVWGATALVCLVVAWWGLPEMKGRSYRELDIMFKRHVPARKFKKYEVGINDDE